MNTRCLFLLLCAGLSAAAAHAQINLMLQPDAAAGQDAKIWSLNPDDVYPDDTEFIAASWTWSGSPGVYRSLVKFDLSSIPAGANVTSATLDLYYSDATGSAGQAGANAAELKRITAPWTESAVTWSNQPAVTDDNMVSLPQTTSASQDYLGIDVQAMVQDMVDNPATAHGFLLKLETESGMASMKFASSDYPEAAQRPRLVVTYDVNSSVDCFTLHPNGENGIDAKIWSVDPDGNYATDDEFIAAAWTWGGSAGAFRSLLKFDLSGVPSGAEIETATLSLYHNPTSGSNGHEGANAANLQRVTMPWSENTVTWNSQPSTTSANQVALLTSTSETEDYPNVDVTALVQDMVNDPANSHGFMLRLADETAFRSMKFASSDYTDAARRPKLEVCYKVSNGVRTPSASPLSIFPTLSGGTFTYDLTKTNNAILVNDVLGRRVKSIALTTNHGVLDLTDLPDGIYFVLPFNATSSKAVKVVIQR